MASKYSVENISTMSEEELRKEAAFLFQYRAGWKYLLRSMPATIRVYHELGDKEQTQREVGRYRYFKNELRRIEVALARIENELAKREALK